MRVDMVEPVEKGRGAGGWLVSRGIAIPAMPLCSSVRRGMATRSAFTVRVQPFISIVRRIDTRHRPYPSIIRCGQWSLAPPYTRLWFVTLFSTYVAATVRCPPVLLVPHRFLPISLRAPFARSIVRTHRVLSLVMFLEAPISTWAIFK